MRDIQQREAELDRCDGLVLDGVANGHLVHPVPVRLLRQHGIAFGEYGNEPAVDGVISINLEAEATRLCVPIHASDVRLHLVWAEHLVIPFELNLDATRQRTKGQHLLLKVWELRCLLNTTLPEVAA